MSKINRKKMLVYPLTMVTFAAVLAGCGDHNTTPNPSTTTPPSSTVSPSTPTPDSSTPVSSSTPDPVTVAVTISGGNEVSKKAPLTLTANVTGASDKTVTWSASGDVVAVNGGVVTVSKTVATDTSVIITATSVADPTKSATHLVTVKAVVVTIGKTVGSVSIKDREVADYDFTALFTITEDGDAIPVTAAMVDATEVTAAEGQYTVTCSYGGKVAVVIVNVSPTVYHVEASVATVELKVKEVAAYDFKALFTVTMDGEPVTVTDSMVTSDVKAETGTYNYKVSYGDQEATVTVTVVEDHQIEIIPAYREKAINQSAIADFDGTTLFSLIVDGKPVKVTPAMVDVSVLKAGVVGQTYDVTMTYSEDSSTKSCTVKVKVVADAALVVNAKNIEIYPNSGHIDITSLFEVTLGGEPVAVTEDMISGFIKYDILGANTLTLTYPYQGENIKKEAVVTVKTGASLSYATADTVVVQKGVDASKYDFAKDFVFTANGRTYAINKKYIDATAVDFGVAGTYTVTVTIPYNETALAAGVASPKDITASITYVVQENVYSITVVNPTVTLEAGVAEYNYLGNISVIINGKNQTLTTVKANANKYTAYVEVDATAVDLTKAGTYKVTIAVYVDGPDSVTPVDVSYKIVVPSTVVITEASNMTVFSGTVVDTKSFFKVTDNGVEVPITADMVEGKVDVFVPGVYGVTLTYKGESKTADVVVLDAAMIGQYSTDLLGSTTTSTDEDDDTVTTVTVKEKFVLNADGSGSLGRSEISGLIGIDGENAIVTIGATNYYLSYDHGILTLVPVNHLHMALVDSTRHYIFAQDSVYTIQDRMTVNSGSSYVIGTPSVPAYSIDMLKVKDKEGKISWFGLKMTLVDHSGSDYYYESESGEITFSDGFVPAVGASGSVSVCGQTYNFTMTEAKVGKVDKEVEHDYMYGGTYTGKVDGKDAVLTVSNYDAFSLTVDGKKVFDFSISDIRSMVNGGIDYANDSALLYDDNNNIAYNIKLDTVNSTFSVIAGDGYAGKYLLTTDSADYDGSYLFLDGFGHGIFKGKGTEYGSRAYLSYTIENGMVKTEFIDTRPIYAYGSYAHFFIDTFHNALVLGYSDIDGLIGLRYETMTVTKGLKVDVSNYIINMTENKQDAVDALLSYFTIVTADGVVSDADKASYIDYSCVDFDHKGFYLVTVKATIDGVDYFKYFTFEVVEPVYEGNPVVGDYTSVYSSSYKLTVNKFGTAEFIYSSTVYKGLVTIADDNSFSFTGTSSSNATVTVTGQLEMNGVVSVTVKGDRSHTNYFVNSDVKTSETGLKRNPVIRTFKNGDEIGYFMCSSETSLGEKVEITSLNGIEAMTTGSVIQLTVSGSEPKIYKVVSSNTWSGLQEPDANRGTYTSTGSESLVLDGFGVSSNEKGLATIGTEKYDYYMFSTSLIALYAPGTTSVFGYATIDGQTYEMLPMAFENSGLVGTFGVVSYSSVSASTHKFAIDAYGVGTYTNSSTAYTGRLIANDDGTYTFVGINKSSSTAKTVTIEIAKIQDLVFSMNITGSVSASNIFMVGYKSTSVQYLGENYSNYITTVTLADDSQVSFFYTSSSATPQVVTVTALNEIPYGTAGSIFSVTALDGTKIIDYAKFVKVATSGGYIKADEKRGTYKATGLDEIVLDGFATVSGGVGEAKVGNAIGTYTIFSGNVLTVNVGDVSYKVTVDPVNGTYAKLEETYSGIFLGTFKEMTTNSSFYGYGMTFDKYGLGVLQTSSSSLYNGTVVFNADGRGFTFSGQSGTSKMDISGKLITDDILAVTYGSKITFYVRDTVTASLYAAETSSKNIIYRVTIGGTDHYLFAPTNTTIVDQEVTLEKCADSPVELGVKDAVFAIKYGETEIVAKYVKAGTNGIVLANMAERKTYTATDGTVLFTDGFTTSQTSRGKATLGTAEYTYFYNPALPNTIMLYDNDGAIAQYATYADDASYVLAEKILEGSRMIEGTYVSMASSYSKFTVDQFGYAVYNSDYYGRFVYNESKGVYEITFVYKSNASRTIYGEAKMLNDGVMLFDYSTKSNYDTGCAYFTVGTSVMTGKSWTNFVYSATVNGVTTYYFAPDRGNDVSTYIGEVTVEIADPELPFGTKGCIFTVKSRTDGSVILKARFLTANGNSGYELSDGMDGTYTCTDHEDIVLDGFGSAVIGAKTGTYTASGTTITITIDGMKYTGDSTAKTYVEAGAMTEDVLANKTFTASYDVYSEGWDGYAGTTTFVFDGLGNVKITSVCTDGYGAYDYSPTFTGDGTYVLTGDKVVVTAKNGATFTFTLNATDNPTSLKCTATSLSSSAHGYCKNETFSLKA